MFFALAKPQKCWVTLRERKNDFQLPNYELKSILDVSPDKDKHSLQIVLTLSFIAVLPGFFQKRCTIRATRAH